MMERCRRCSMPRRRCDWAYICHCCGADRPWKVYMNEKEWLTSTDIQAMLRVALDHGISPRKLRLLACALLRAAGTRGHDNFYALRTAEDFADGLLSDEMLRHEHAIVPSNLLGEFVLRPDPLDAVRSVLAIDPLDVGGSVLAIDPLGDGGREAAPALLRDLVGNPFRPLGKWDSLTWVQGDPFRLARTIYHERTYTDLPVLADALEDAGCDNEHVLRHLRGEEPIRGPHARGCWVLDLILGKCWVLDLILGKE